MKNINTKDLETKCEYYKGECEYWQKKCGYLEDECEGWKSVCEYYKSKYDDLKSKYDDLENKYAYLESAYIKSDAAQNSYKLLLDLEMKKNDEYTKETTSFINSLIQTNTLVSGQKTYLMYDDITQKFMIGKSYDPYETEKELYLCRGSIYMVAYCDYDIESVLHSMYSENRVKDEWFNLSTKQVSWIIEYFGMKITNQNKLNEFYETANLPF